MTADDPTGAEAHAVADVEPKALSELAEDAERELGSGATGSVYADLGKQTIVASVGLETVSRPTRPPSSCDPPS